MPPAEGAIKLKGSKFKIKDKPTERQEKLRYQIQQFKISFPADTCRCQIGSDVSHRCISWAGLYDQRPFHARFGHDDVVAFLSLNFKSFKLKDPDEFFVMQRSDFTRTDHF